MNTMVVQQTRFWRWFWNGLRLLTVVAMVAGMLPLDALAAPAAEAPAATGAAAPAANLLPGWMQPGPAARSATLLPAWLAEPAADSAAKLLPAWYRETTPAGAKPRPKQLDIPEALLTVNVYGPPVASLGAPATFGEVYTVVVRNNSTQIAYNFYLTATYPTFFIYDGAEQLVHSISGTLAINTTSGAGVAQWQPVTMANLAPGDAVTLTFRLRATCAAQSGQMMRVWFYYNADPPPASPVEYNEGALNITAGRGNLVIRKDPALQNLGTPDFGQPVTWTVTVQNTGLGLIYGATVTDTGGINLGQPGGDLVPAVTIPVLGINETRQFTVVGRVEACNFTNVAETAWPCGNLVGDATFTNPLRSTASILFTPQVPNVNLQITSPITEPYCTPLTRTVTITLNNTGGPAGAFHLDSALESNGYWELVPGSLPADWQYLSGSGVFSYTGGSPTGTLPAAGQAGLPVVLSFQLRPQATALCGAASGEIGFLPLYQDVCSHAPFTGTPVSLIYQSASDGAPTISVDKSGPGLVHVGELITYVITLNGSNPQSINGAITVTDLLPTPFALVSLTATNGTVTSTGQTVTWLYDPPDSGAFPQTLIYVAQVLTTTGGVCGGSNIYDNDVLARANPLCPGCAQLVDSDRVTTAIENNEGVTASSGAAGSTEVCGVNGLVISRRYEISGSMVITWTGSRFTETLGQGPGGLPGPAYLVYQAGSLSVTINGVDYTGVLTPVTTTGQLVLDLTPLQTAVPAVPTQNVTLLLTYTLAVPESVLDNAVEVDFYDWARLFLVGVSTNQACAANGAFNQALPLHLSRGDLQVGLSPLTLNRCETNQVTLSVTDNQPTRLADHIVITFTASTAEIMSARNFSYTGSLAAISPITVVTQSAIGGGLGIITFTLPANTDLNGNGTILFDVDLRCGEGVPWTAGIVFQSRCAITHGHQTVRDHLYREPGLLLFATPLQYTVREKQVIWKFFVTNNGNLTATNVQVTNELYGLAVTGYTADQGGAGISVSGTLPITTPNPAVFTVASLAPGEQRAVTVTAEVMVCNPLTVVLRARYSCFGAVCNEPQAQVNFNTPDPYLLTNNGETAALPMCDIGQIVFTTKNSSPDVTLYNLFITETLRGLLPIPGAPMTVTIEDPHHNVLATTTQFTPLQQWAGSDLLLTWRPISAPTEVLSWFLALPPLYVVRIFVPVRTSCVPPNTPQSFAAASAQGPCGQHLGYTENAVSLQTLRPDMSLTKDGQVEGGTFGKTLYALPGDTIIWRLRVRNLPSDQAYVAHNVVLSDTWPAIFNFITVTTAYTPHIDPASRTITWALGDVGIGSDIYFYLTGTVAVSSTACLASALNRTQLSFGCDDGCSSALVPQDSANLSTAPNLVLALAPQTFQLCDNTITLTVRNQGATAFTNTLTMTIPSGYVYDGLVSSGLAVTQIYTDHSAPRFYWDLIPGSEPNQPYSFDLVVRVVNSGTVGTCPNANGQPVTATMDYDDHPTCTDSGPFRATTSGLLNVLTPNLVIDKTPPFRTAQVGERITWTLRMTNTGTGLAAQVLITDVVDSSFTGVTATNGGLVTGNLITWTLTDLPANGVWTAQVSAILLSSGDNRNVVTATAYCASGCTSTSAQDSAQVTLLQEFQKNPEIQTGTIGSLVVFTFTASLPDVDALYDNVIFTDTLPNGLGYVASELRYTYDADGSSGGPVALISPTPTLSPTYLQPGNLIWRLGTLPGSIQVAGVVTAVIRDIASNYNGVRLTNLLSMTYVDEGQPYVYTDTANVDIVEPLLHIGKSYETPSGCGATLLQDNFNRTSASPPTSWTAVTGSWNNPNGVAQQSSNNTTNALLVRSGFTADDFSYSAMIQALDASSSRGLVFRYTTNNYYLVRLRQGDGGNNIQVQEIAAGTFYTLATVAITPATNRWYHVEARVETVATGLRIRVYIDGQPTLDVTDPTPRAAGSVGLYANACANNQCQFDDVLVTRLQNSACTVGANDLVTYTLTVSNQARIPGYDLFITDVIPAGTSLVTYTLQSDDPLAQVTAAPTPIPGATGTLVWQLNQLTATTPFSPLRHTALTLTVVLRVAPTISVNTFLDNQAFLSYSGQPGSGPLGVERPYSGGSHSTAIRTLSGGLTKTVAFAPPPTATLGTLVTYTLLVPATPITATYYDVVVTDVIDSRLRIEGVEFSGGTGGAASWLGQLVTATFATIPAGTQALITVTARISHEWPNAAGDANAGQTITNVAVMTSSTTPLTTSNVVSTVVGEPLLSIFKTAGALTNPQTALYTVTVVNNGSAPAYSLVITDTPPAGITVTNLFGNGVLAPDGRTITWTVTSLDVTPPGNTVVFTYLAQLTEAIYASPWVTNTATVRNTSLTETIPGVRPYITNTSYPLNWPLGRLGDYVWYDFDYNGIQGTHPGEFPIGGVVLDLFDSTTGAYISSTTTNASGYYIFQYLPLNVTYTVRISDVSYLPGGPLAAYTQTLWLAPGSTPANDSNASITATFGGLGYAITTTLTPAFTQDLTLDYGFVRLVEIGNYVWLDINHDGIQNDDTIYGRPGVTLTVTYPDGRVFTTTTDTAGYYTFTVPISSVYTITVIAANFQPGGPLETFTNTLRDAGGDDAVDSDGQTSGGGLVTVTPVITQNNYTFDFGVWQPMQLGDYIWYDWNNNGITDTGESGIPGVVVELYRDTNGDGVYTPGVDQIISTTTTNAAGYYLFNDLTPSLYPTQTYLVVITGTNFTASGVLSTYVNSTGYVTGNSDLNSHDHGVVYGTPGSGGYVASTPVSLTLNSEPVNDGDTNPNSNLTIDFGFYRLSLGDLLWYDYNNNGIYEPWLTEAGVPGVVVELYRAGQTPGVDTPLLTTTTNAAGRYLFTGLAEDLYFVHIPLSEFGVGRPLHYYTSTIPTQVNPNTDANENVDENGIVNGYGVSSGIITLTTTTEPTGEDVTGIDGGTPDNNSNLTVDFGFFNFVSLGNYVWYDVNNNGLAESGEAPVPGVVVELYQDTNGDGVFTPGVDTYQGMTTTNASGLYLFPNLLPTRYPTETYLVVITGTNFLPGAPLYQTQSSDGSVAGDSDLNNRDHGVVAGTLGAGGYVASTAVTLTVGGEPINDDDTDANSNLTLDFGFYRLSLGDFVWYDANNNGLWDSGEMGAPGVTVRLVDATGTTVLLTTTTDANGLYTFTGLLSATYYVEIVIPATYTSSTDIASSANPDNNVNSDDNGVTFVAADVVRSGPVTLVPGDSGALGNNAVTTATGSTYNPTVDFGLVHEVSLGNYVWYDVNNNGLAESGEAPVPGVAVELYQDTNGDGFFTPGVDTYLGMTTTNASGLYLFPNLLPTRYPTETYLVVITSTNFLPGGPLYQYQNSDGSVDGDSDLNNQDHGVVVGTLGAGGYVASTAVTLTVGGEPTNDGDDDANSNLTLDFGFYQLSLGDQVWYDDNNNGVLDGGEVGAPGVTVRLVDATGTTVLLTTTTDANGFYTFTGLLSATYYVEIVIPATYTSSTDIASSGNPDNNVNSDDNGVTFVAADVVRSGPVTLVPGDSGALSNTAVNTATGSTYNPTVDFGLYALVSLGNYVWYDVNNNGLAESGEAPVPGVAVELYQDTNGDGVFTPGVDTYLSMTTTNASGYYLFPDLLPTRYPTQTYLVVVTSTNFLPGGPLYQTQSSDGSVDGDSDLNNQDHGVVAGTLGAGGWVASTAVTLTAGDEPPYPGYPDDDSDTRSNLTLDFGFYRLSLGDFVWYDVNNNGVWDSGEAPASGITVRLVDATGTTVLLTTTTDANGLYTFTGLLSATYYVEIVIPDTYTSSTDIASSGNPDNNVNSDDNGVTFVAADVVRSGPVTLVPGDSGALGNNTVTTATGSTYNPTVDFGLVPGVSLGNYVWYDVNNNGLAESGEAPVPGVVVELYQDTNGDGFFTPGVDTYLGMTTTNASGLYLFPDLLPTRYPTETYLVVITSTNFLPGGPLYQYQNSDGSVDGDSDLNNQDHGVVVGTLGAGGYVASTAVTLTVGGEPTNDDDTDANSNLTIDFGFYQLGLGNQVWLDTNNDGLLNNGEVGLPGVEVRLYDISGTLIATTTTGVNGYYSFTGLLSGTYVVEIVPPAVYTSSTDIGSSGNPDNNVDNDDNGVNWLTGTLTSNPITLVPGDSGALSNTTVNTATGSTFNPTVDFGLYSLVSLGDYVWYDVNNNGVAESGEAPVPGVVVELYQDTNGDGIFTPGVDTYLSMTTTNASGYYLFPDLLPSLTPTGTYLVVITSTNFLPGAPLYQTQNSDGFVDGNSDLNDQDHGVVVGTLGAGGYVASTAISLTVGGEPVNDGDTNPNSNLTIDFGFYQLSLGDFVWYDANNNGVWDSGEAPAPGITVRLVDATGTTVLLTTTTDANGLYTFTGLLSGTYRVEIVIPATYTSSTDIASSGNPNNNVNSDDNGVTYVVSNVVQSGPVTLVPGDSGALGNNTVLTPTGSTHNPTVDFGLVQLFPAIDLDKTVLPGLAAPHMPFTYVIVISNVGQLTLDPLILTDTLPAGFHYQVGTGDPADPDLIAEPLLRWNNLGALPPGGVITVSFAVTVERGILGTFYNVALAEGDHPGGIVTDTDDVPILIQDPAIDLSKHLIGYDTDLVAPNFVTFTIEMTNIGPTPINVLPLVDHYDPYYLSFVTSTPYPEEPADDGLLTWYNLTGPAPYGFGRFLLPGETFVVTTVFRVAHDIINITTTNIATTTQVTDLYDNPTPDDTDQVDVPGTDGGIPTAVDLLYFRAVGQEQAIRLEWATAAELNNFGFRVLRAAEPEYTRASELVFIPSFCRGNLCGATYVYTDTTALPETAYWYWLADVDTDGRETLHGPASAQLGLLMAKFRLYLPLVLKAR